ncbi:Mitochondrial import inner membrane translocase subunit Tim16 [Trichinella sp. T8]|nr:Mitochondrial import inner membrane translocase subunit Tim16 [Trichinella sp. T8]
MKFKLSCRNKGERFATNVLVLPRYIAQIIIIASQVFGRALSRALREELSATKYASKPGSSSAKATNEAISNLRHGMTLEEARQILNVSEKLDQAEIEKRYNHLFSMNDKAKGGSFYLQSKVVRAKERLEAEIKNRGLKNARKQANSDGSEIN